MSEDAGLGNDRRMSSSVLRRGLICFVVGVKIEREAFLSRPRRGREHQRYELRNNTL